MSLTCKVCGKTLNRKNTTGYCIDHLRESRRQKTLANWLATGDTGCSVVTTQRNCIRTYIFDQQDGKCAICGMDSHWNGKALKFILDHIDGDAANNCKSNLRLICPNCDSQLDTYKSKNKNSARAHRHISRA